MQATSQYPEVDILLAVYNGEKYLSAFLDSVLEQNYTNWKMLVHDDGSIDSTLDIIRKYSSLYPKKIILIEDGIEFKSAKENFFNLMKYSKNKYIMFADQDDVWLKSKIDKSLDKIMYLEKRHQNKPILVHSDLTVVDKNLHVLQKSMNKYLGGRKSILNNMILFNNCATGCTFIFNSKLLQLSLLNKEYAIMHDWWVLLTCYFHSGKVFYDDNSYVLYRQHENNVCGISKKSTKYFLARCIDFFKTTKLIHKQSLAYTKSYFLIFLLKKLTYKLL